MTRHNTTQSDTSWHGGVTVGTRTLNERSTGVTLSCSISNNDSEQVVVTYTHASVTEQSIMGHATQITDHTAMAQ